MTHAAATACSHLTLACCVGEPLSAVAFSQDGSLLAAASGDAVTLWDAASNSLVTTLAAPRTAQVRPSC